MQHSRFWQAIHAIERGEVKIVRECDGLVLDTCPDYRDAMDSLLGLESAPLTLATQATCRELRLLVDRLSMQVAMEFSRQIQEECGS